MARRRAVARPRAHACGREIRPALASASSETHGPHLVGRPEYEQLASAVRRRRGPPVPCQSSSARCSAASNVTVHERGAQRACMHAHRRSASLDLAHGESVIRDGNGDPIPDSPRGLPPLGDVDGEETSPAGI
jgi:hypothetical protein